MIEMATSWAIQETILEDGLIMAELGRIGLIAFGDVGVQHRVLRDVEVIEGQVLDRAFHVGAFRYGWAVK